VVTLGVMGLEIYTDKGLTEEGYSTHAFRLLTDLSLGAEASAANAVSHGGSRFSWKAFAQGMEYTAGGIFYVRVVAVRGYRPFDKTLDDVETMRQALTSKDQVLVFKMKTDLNPSFRVRWDSPLGDMVDLGWYHEVLLGVSQDKLYVTEFGAGGARSFGEDIGEAFSSKGGFSRSLLRNGVGSRLDKAWGINPMLTSDRNLQYLGTASKWGEGGFMEEVRKNPLDVKLSGGRRPESPKPYNILTRNCQKYVSAIVSKLKLSQ
jgi:hypothetical protein